MFDLDTYIADIGNNPNKIEKIMMEYKQAQYMDNPIWEHEQIQKLISSMFMIEHDCDFLDIDEDEINCRYMIIEKSKYHKSIIITMNFKKGTIHINRYVFDNEEILSERKMNLLITDFREIVFFMNCFI